MELLLNQVFFSLELCFHFPTIPPPLAHMHTQPAIMFYHIRQCVWLDVPSLHVHFLLLLFGRPVPPSLSCSACCTPDPEDHPSLSPELH